MFAMAGLGEARRSYHRAAVANKIRNLRRLKSWSQEELAERLGVNRRQVVRLESQQVPVTLEVAEALARAFGVLSVVFMFSAVKDNEGDIDVDSGWARRVAEQEFRNLFGGAVERPRVRWLIESAILLPDKEVELLGRVADAFLRAREEGDPDASSIALLTRAFVGVAPHSHPNHRSTRTDASPPHR
jgi:transcriptional regulator with XRE-family HTH domain